METVLGDLRVVDAHVHYFSRRFYMTLAGAAGIRPGGPAEWKALGDRLGWELPEEDPAALADRWVGELDRHGVARTVLIASVPGDEDSVRAAVAAHPERFIGYFMVDPAAEGTAERVRLTLADPGMRGVCLFPAMHRVAPSDRRLDPIFEEAAARRAVVFVHCGVLRVGVRDRLGLPSPFDLRLGNPLEVGEAAARHPGTTFVIPHFGAGFWRETLMAASACPNICVDTSSSNDWMKTQAEPINLSRVLARTIGVLGVERVLFGTDSSFLPRGWRADVFREQLRAVEDLGLPPEAARALFGGNLERVVGG